MSTPLLQIRFENNGTGHDDLVLYFGDHRLVADSYYLSLDTIEAGDESPEKTLRVLVRLLEQWLVYLENGFEGETCYLPWDFSDQSTGWLRCRFEKTGLVEIQPGIAAIEGWSFMPSNIGDQVENVDGFEPLDDVDPIRIARGLFEMEITASIGEAENGMANTRGESTPQVAESSETTLDQLQIGERGIVIKVTGDPEKIACCRNHGLTNGAEVVLLCFGDSGRQVEYEIAGDQHALNRDAAASVKIKRIAQVS